MDQITRRRTLQYSAWYLGSRGSPHDFASHIVDYWYRLAYENGGSMAWEEVGARVFEAASSTEENK